MLTLSGCLLSDGGVQAELQWSRVAMLRLVGCSKLDWGAAAQRTTYIAEKSEQITTQSAKSAFDRAAAQPMQHRYKAQSKSSRDCALGGLWCKHLLLLE